MDAKEFFQPTGDPSEPDNWKYQVVGCNTCNVHDAYKTYFQRIARCLSELRVGDLAHFSGWLFQADLVLVEGDSGTRLDILVKAATRQGAEVRFIATKTPNDPAAPFDILRNAGATALVDQQIVESHAKVAYFRLAGRELIFVGGMDLAGNRLNRWHDVQVELDGDAAALGFQFLQERWFSVYNETHAAKLAFMRMTRRQKVDTSFPYYIQFVRTCAPATSASRTYATRGDFSCYSSLFRALSIAEKSIYVEDQSIMGVTGIPYGATRSSQFAPKFRHEIPGTSRALDDVFLGALAKKRNDNAVCKVFVSGGWASGKFVVEPFKSNSSQLILKVRAESVLPLKTPAGDKLAFVHSKTWLIDDRLLIVGSANYWPPSFDAIDEFGVAVLLPSPAHGRSLRIKLWHRIRLTFDPADKALLGADNSFAQDAKNLVAKVGENVPFHKV
jgi:phosphatidylserine/phosphatidylglycerophosphate/cardiolipin synthase-like enzyme